MKLFKRCAAVLFGLSLIIGFQIPSAKAGDLILGGQKHEYKVVLRGDGRAIVVGKLTVPNTGMDTLTSIRVGLSVDDATQMTAYQLIVDQTCSKFDNTSGTPICTKYKDISSKDVTTAEYKKITIIEASPQKYTLSLPSAVEVGRTSVILFAYSSKQYTTESFGLYSYDFSTPTIDERIDSMSVSVQTDSDLYIDGEDSSIQYGSRISSSTSDVSELSADSAMAMMMSTRGNTVRNTATDLFPGESYTVTGRYSEFWWRLSLGKIITGIVILVILIGLGIWKSRRMLKTESIPLKQRIATLFSGNYLANGLFTAVLIGVWSAIVMNLMKSTFLRHIDNGLAEMLIGFVVLMIYVPITFGPSIAVGAKKGWKAGIMTFIGAIVWLIIGIALLGAFDGGSAPVFLEY